LETVFSAQSVQRGCEEDSWSNRVSSVREYVRKRGSWKGAAIQRGLEHGSRRIAIVRSRCQATAVWKRLAVCSSDL
jgi:hypothetical protein